MYEGNNDKCTIFKQKKGEKKTMKHYNLHRLVGLYFNPLRIDRRNSGWIKFN